VPYPPSVARDIIDDRFIGALHLRALTHAGLDHDPVVEHTAIQAGTLDALMVGGYAGDTSLGELLRLGSHGIGTVQSLDGELIVIDGEAWSAHADGAVTRLDPETLTPFAVVAGFDPTITTSIETRLTLHELHTAIDGLSRPSAPVLAIRIDGTFSGLALRSVERQDPPYKPLREIVAHQTEWSIAAATGTIVGFRFPDATAGVEVSGYHLHFISDDRSIGGHVLSLALDHGTIAIDPCRDLHVELPAGVSLGVPGAADRDEIARLEGGT
jgi:acetolactate decarboxylase